MKLDKILDTWNNLEDTYQRVGKGKSRREFLTRQLSDDAIAKLRSLIASDFVATEENLEKSNFLFSILEHTKNKLRSETGEITDLNFFIWGNEDNAVILEDFEINKQTFVEDGSSMISKKVFSSSYVLDGGKVFSNVLDGKSEELVSFNSLSDAYAWLFMNSKISESSSFRRGVYAYTLNALKSLSLPIAFVKGAAGKSEGHSAEKTFKTLGGEPFRSTATYRESVQTTFAGKVKVVLVGGI